MIELSPIQRAWLTSEQQRISKRIDEGAEDAAAESFTLPVISVLLMLDKIAKHEKQETLTRKALNGELAVIPLGERK